MLTRRSQSGSGRVSAMRPRARPRVCALEERAVPATLVNSILSPDILGPQRGANFGFSAAISSDYRVVAAPRSLYAGGTGQVFVYSATSNNLISTLNNPAPAIAKGFGAAIAVDGGHVIVGSNIIGSGAADAGAAFVYDLTSATPTVPIVTLDNPASPSGRFGNSVALSGKYVVVGSYYDDTGATEAGSTYVFDISSPTPNVPVFTLHNPTPAANDNFGASVGVSGQYVVIGANRDDTGASDAGSVYVYDLTSVNPSVPIYTLSDPNPTTSYSFGISVSISTKTVVVGALDRSLTGSGGAAYVYNLDSNTPTVPTTSLSNPTPASGDSFGISAAINGSHVVIGAKDAGATHAGIVYVFDISSITPNVPIVIANNPMQAGGDELGNSVAVFANFFIAGAPRNDAGLTDTGSAYVYDLTSPTPATPIATLFNATPGTNSHLGTSVAMSGNLMIAGAPFEPSLGVGAAHVYDVASANPATPILNFSNPTPAIGDSFGESVAISGKYVIVGASLDDTFASNAGAAYLYDLSSATPTVPIVNFTFPAPAVNDGFGGAVAVSGKYVVVGAPNRRSAYVYDLTSANPATPAASLTGSNGFGYSVALSGKYVVVGAFVVDLTYVYDLSSTTPTVAKFIFHNPAPTALDGFGESVAIAGNSLIVGVPYNDSAGTNAGLAYMYDLSSPAPYPVAIPNPNPTAADLFGQTVAVSDKYVVISARLPNQAPPQIGAAYVYSLSGVTASPIATVTNPNPKSADEFGNSITISDDYVTIGAPNDHTQNLYQGAAFVYKLTPPRVTGVKINDGSAQRSSVTSITVSFDTPVSFVGGPAGAFSLVNQKFTITPVVLSAAVDASNKSVTLTFSGSVNGQSLVDGRYVLTVLANHFGGDGLDGNGDGIGGDSYVLVGSPANGLFRLFGDGDGNGRVDGLDFGAFRSAYGTSNSIFSFDGTGPVDATDFNQFRQRFGVVI